MLGVMQVNHGQGWGIPVVKGLVLNKTMIQALLLRIVVAATVIKAFLDRQLGFQKDWIHAGARHHGDETPTPLLKDSSSLPASKACGLWQIDQETSDLQCSACLRFSLGFLA